MRPFGRSVVPALAGILVLSCGSGGGDAAPGPGGGGSAGSGGSGGSGCTPPEAAYTSTIRPILEARCGQCHGQKPDWGAPFTLLDYATVAGEHEGRPIADLMVEWVGSGEMPPAGQPRLTQEEFRAVLDWASCGTANDPYEPGLLASSPVFASPSAAPAGLDRVDLTAGGDLVAAGTTDDYRNYVFSNVVTEERFVRRFEVKLDQSRVVHHVTLHYANGADTAYLYAWAPGTGAVQFPDGGLRVKPTDRFRVEIHYNNYSATEDAVDASGISLFLGPPEGTEYGMADPCTFGIAVPPMAKGTAVAEYTALADFRVLAGMPHMHEIGAEFLHEIHRQDGTTDTLISLTGWSFASQFFYSMPAEVKAGERMTITCTYQNDKDHVVRGGLGTTDEMCYDFMYITPPGGLKRCMQ